MSKKTCGILQVARAYYRFRVAANSAVDPRPFTVGVLGPYRADPVALLLPALGEKY